MIIGVGFDLVDNREFGQTLSQSGEAFLKRVYTEREIDYCESQPQRGQCFAARFAAKEAAMKAMGVAGDENLQWRDLEVILRTVPELELHGYAATRAEQLGIERVRISLSHTISAAGAVAIAEGIERPRSRVRAPRSSRSGRAGR